MDRLNLEGDFRHHNIVYFAAEGSLLVRFSCEKRLVGVNDSSLADFDILQYSLSLTVAIFDF